MTDPTGTASGSGAWWAWAPALLLGSMLTGLGVMAYVAIDDPSFALEPSYYDKAIHWDAQQAEAEASRELGLRLVMSPLVLTSSGAVDVELRVSDRHGAPFTSAELRLEAFANARASRVEKLLLSETAPGVYRAQIGAGLRGLWELRVNVTRGTARYREVLRREIKKAGAA